MPEQAHSPIVTVAPVVPANHIPAWRAIVRSLPTSPRQKINGAREMLFGKTFREMEMELGYAENYLHKILNIDGWSNKARAAMAGYIYCDLADIWTPDHTLRVEQ
ncbi:MAG: hypothetical protein KQI62_02100 [Deltaproteobacteria bacterium]|nr:hypothetical protein [Deltaproteobacteria bacterium]